MFCHNTWNRGVTAPPGLQNGHRSLEPSPRPSLKATSDGSPLTLSPSTAPSRPNDFARNPLPASVSTHNATPKKRKTQPTTPRATRTPKRQRIQAKPPQNAQQPTPRSPHAGGNRIRSLGSLGRLLEDSQTDEDMPDLSFLDDWSAGESKSPEASPAQPRTPDLYPGKTLSRFRDRSGNYHEVPVVILDDDVWSVDAAMSDSNGSRGAAWNRGRLRERPLIPSIERDPSVVPFAQFRRPIEPRRVNDSEAVGEDEDMFDAHSSTRTVSIPLVNSVSLSGAIEMEGSEAADEDDVVDIDPNIEFYVKRITGVKYGGPGGIKYRIEWLDYPDAQMWVPEGNCSCPDAIEEFRVLFKEELLAVFRDGQRHEYDKLLRLGEATGMEIDNVDIPKHRRWKNQRRSALGRFASRGTRDTRLEILRLPTVPREVRAGTARPPTRQLLVNSPGAEEPLDGGEVVWICTKVREGRRFRGTLKKEPQDARVSEHRNLEMEQEEMERRQRVDAEEERCAAEKRADKKEVKNAQKREEKKRLEREKLERKEARQQLRKLRKEQQRVASEKQREEEEAGKHKKAMQEKAKAEQQKRLEDTVRYPKYRSPTIVKDDIAEETRFTTKHKNKKTDRILANASESAAQQEIVFGATSAVASLVNNNNARHTRTSSSFSVVSNYTKFRNLRAEEEQARETQIHVRSEFRHSQSIRQARNLIEQSGGRILPPRRRRKTFSQ